jgi:antitoxin (DNA-binding transcriptional repressor) of toxin-antitoxin stability system
LSVIVTLAPRLPVADGENVTETAQDAPAASVPPQVVVRAKSAAFAPVTAMLEIDSAAVPEFVSVTDFAELGEPTSCEPKLRLVGASVTAGAGVGGAGVVPVPDSETECGLPAALSTIETLALRLPAAEGENVTETVHDDPAARVLPHVVVRAKSDAFAPASATLLIASGPAPVFVTVADFAEPVDPTSCDPKLKLEGETLTAGVGGGGDPDVLTVSNASP